MRDPKIDEDNMRMGYTFAMYQFKIKGYDALAKVGEGNVPS